MSHVQIVKATGGRLRRYPAKNRGKSTIVRRLGKFAEAKTPFCLPVVSVNVEARQREARCAKGVRPAQSCVLVRIVVRRSVRFSWRPCPLLTVVAVLPACGPTGSPLGGKKSGPPPLLVLPTQTRLDVDGQRRLIVLDREDVVAPLINDLLAEVALAEEGVACDDAASDGHNAQQLQGRLVTTARPPCVRWSWHRPAPAPARRRP